MSRDAFILPALVVCTLMALTACGGGGGGGGTAAQPTPGFHLTGIFPPNGSQDFDPTGKLIVTFSHSLESDSEAEDHLVLTYRDTGQIVSRDVVMTIARQVASLQPDVSLEVETWFTLRIRGDIRSTDAGSLGEDHVIHFRTSADGGNPPPPPPPPAGGKIRQVGNMASGRSSHVSELLPTGKVLVAGGFDTANSVTDTAELFDPTAETFSGTTTRMVNARGFHASVALGNGSILITGGVSGPNFAETSSTEIFNPTSGQFGGAGSMVFPRAFHTMTLLDDGRVLIAGGTVPGTGGSFSSKRAELYNPSDGSYSVLPDMSVFRAGHTATLLPDGRVLLVGGNSTDARGELFNPLTDTFSLVGGSMQVARRGHTATHIKDGVVLLMGGGSRTADLFVLDQDLFRSANSYPLYDRTGQTVNWTSSGRLLFTGGSYYSGLVLFFSLTTEYYEPRSGTFSPSQLLLLNPTTRHRATELADGRILITGGSNLDSTQPELKGAMIYEEE